MSLENIVEKGALLDCYGGLLSDRQRECLDLYYNENLSLGEIAEEFHISRQAVHDAMQRGEEQLAVYEAALGMTKMRAAAKKLAALAGPGHQDEAAALLKIVCEGR